LPASWTKRNHLAVTDALPETTETLSSPFRCGTVNLHLSNHNHSSSGVEFCRRARRWYEMKETLDSSIPAGISTDGESFANRKLIRPSLNRNEHNHNSAHNHAPSERRERSAPAAKKSAPVEQTNAENFYYQKQMQTKTAMVIVLRDGEEVHGIIEWYDKNCIKLNRTGAPNLMIYKPAIKYMFKEGENERK